MNQNNKMIAALLLSLYLANPTSYAGTPYLQQESSEGTVGPSPENAVVDVFFVDDRTGWIVMRSSDTYSLFRTLNGGSSWERSDLPFMAHQVFFLDRNIGWASYLTVDGPDHVTAHLAFTEDGGTTWNHLSTLPTIMPYPAGNFLFSDKNAGMFVGGDRPSPAELLHTQNGGKSFEEVTITEDTRDSLIRAFRDSRGGMWAVGEDLVIRSLNGGITWEVLLSRQNLPSELQCEYDFCVRLYSGWMMPGGEGWVVGFANESPGALILSTRDFGSTWTVAMRTEKSTSFDDVYFADPYHGCVVGLSPLIFCTSDGGQTWVPIDLPASLVDAEKVKVSKYGYRDWLHFTRIVLLPSGRGWLTTDGGYLFQTDDWGKHWKEQDLVKSANHQP